MEGSNASKLIDKLAADENLPPGHLEYLRRLGVSTPEEERVVEEFTRKTRFRIHRPIGSGGYGDVYYGTVDMPGRGPVECAIKVINVEEMLGDASQVQREMQVLNDSDRCEQLTRYYHSEMQDSNLVIGMEYMNAGSAADVCRDRPLPEWAVALVVREVLRGLLFLHGESKKVHRDIKSANILLDRSGRVKLADFGATGQITETVTKCQTKAGTLLWMAPEVIQLQRYDYRADVWSLGITCIELATGAHPFRGLGEGAFLRRIAGEAPRLDERFSEEFRHFVAQCLMKEMTARPQVKSLLRHPFVRTDRPVTDLAQLWNADGTRA